MNKRTRKGKAPDQEMPTQATQAPELKLIPPESIQYGDTTTRVGGTVYRALSCILARASGAGVSVKALEKAVWGAERIVAPETLRGVIFRANQLLKAFGHPRRVMLSEDRVLFE